MALTKSQTDLVMKLFVLLFVAEKDEQKRKKPVLEFEDTF